MDSDKVKYSLVLQSFGNEKEYRRAVFCILSHASFNEGHCDKTILFTDNPDYFRSYLKGMEIRYILLTPEKIKAMRGKINFLHRMKIVIIEEAFSMTKEKLLYVDSDCYFMSSPAVLMEQISPNVSGMHVREYPFKNLKDMALPAGETFRAFYNLIASNEFLWNDGASAKISGEEFSWNAGAMMFHPSHQKLMDDVYKLTEQFYPATMNHASEQYAFSIVLQRNTSIIALDKAIYHYWYRIKKNIVDDTLEKELDDLLLTKSVRFEKIKQLTIRFELLLENHHWMLKDKAIQAFHENRFSQGYGFALRALMKNPLDKKFIMDVGYHTRRWLQISFR